VEHCLSQLVGSFLAHAHALQAHGPLLHLHFMATLPDKQGSGMGRSLLEHLERMADAGGWVGWQGLTKQTFAGGIGRLWGLSQLALRSLASPLPQYWGSRRPAD
jgi:GNAT superfamily N-acetyltransferase